MNKKAEELGLENTHFVTPHGLDEEEHYTTAYELAIITDYALKTDKIKEVVKTKNYTVTINGYSKSINNTNELLGSLNGVTGVKTGFTNGAGRCLVTSVERNGFNIITVVLGADTKKIRTKDSIKLIEYVYSNYELVDLTKEIEEEYIKWCNINKNRIIIAKAKNSNVLINIDEYKFAKYPVKKEEMNNIKYVIQNIQLEFEAPVYSKTQVAELNVNIGNKKIKKLKIYIENIIERKNTKDFFKESLPFGSFINSKI